MRARSIVLAVMCTTALTGCAASTTVPAFDFGANTPDDLRALAAETMDRAASALPLRLDCLDGVTLVGAWELEDRAQYRPERSEIAIRIPATAPQLETSLIHELAHHLEYTCVSQIEIRSDFLVAQGFDSKASWTDGDRWEATPSEHWASAVVMHVLNRSDTRARIAVSGEALDIVAAWAGSS